MGHSFVKFSKFFLLDGIVCNLFCQRLDIVIDYSFTIRVEVSLIYNSTLEINPSLCLLQFLFASKSELFLLQIFF
jgi:hypothetical protein